MMPADSQRRARVPSSDAPGSIFYASRCARRHRLHVWSSDAAEVIRLAGGFICDRAMCGWEVRILISDSIDDRPLRILGADHVDAVDSSNSPSAENFSSQATAALDEELEWFDPQVICTVTGDTTLTVSDWSGAGSLVRRGTHLEYNCSSAARLFKAHALIAANALPDGVAAAEHVRLLQRGGSITRPRRSRLSQLPSGHHPNARR
jgi:hypothetical protein